MARRLASRPVIQPVGPTFGASIGGIDLRARDEHVDDLILAAWHEYGLLIFPGQHLTPAEQVRVARRFGPLEFEICAMGNVDQDDQHHTHPADALVRTQRANEGWHHDSSYLPVLARGAVVSAEIVPSVGGATGWVDMYAAYDALDEDMRTSLEDLAAYHSLYFSQLRAAARGVGGGQHHEGDSVRSSDKATYPRTLDDLSERLARDGIVNGRLAATALRPLVAVDPVSGRRGLLVGEHAFAVVGLDADASEDLLDGLMREACQAPRVVYHEWSVEDVVLWNNRRLAHRGTPYDITQPRRIWHTRIAGDPTTDRSVG